MTDVSVRNLKNSLSEYLRRVQDGEEIIVVSRKRPVARLSPLQNASGKRNIHAVALRRLRELPGVSWTGEKPEPPNKLVKLRGSKLASEIVSGNRD
ncbi:MAG: type II toxin-antitoxin system Phd/YefM family antitoxin [Pyrinomonadaceae bacterium]